MPYRTTPLVAGEIYHVFNRSIARKPIFTIRYDYLRAVDLINYYRYPKLPLRFSHFKRLPPEGREKFFKKYLDPNLPRLRIVAFCLMPNHFHFLLQGVPEMGISDFLKNFQHSYAKYFNLKYDRSGSVFQAMYKAVRIETDEQLIHVSRYIHLNPVTSFVTKPELVDRYQWSSLKEYLFAGEELLVNPELVLNQFKSKEDYRRFILDQVDYQRKLGEIKHLALE